VHPCEVVAGDQRVVFSRVLCSRHAVRFSREDTIVRLPTRIVASGHLIIWSFGITPRRIASTSARKDAATPKGLCFDLSPCAAETMARLFARAQRLERPTVWSSSGIVTTMRSSGPTFFVMWPLPVMSSMSVI